MRERLITLEESLKTNAIELARIFVHELFHFVWLRLGNGRRWSYEGLVAGELRNKVRGELGWSAEWRKTKLEPRDWRERTRIWREYCCESFCDTAAWRYAGVKKHREFTLAADARAAREDWFAHQGLDRNILI